MKGITLVLDRAHNDLWLDVNGKHVSCMWHVTGLERNKESFFDNVRISRNDRQIGSCWDVKEIRERWEL